MCNSVPGLPFTPGGPFDDPETAIDYIVYTRCDWLFYFLNLQQNFKHTMDIFRFPNGSKTLKNTHTQLQTTRTTLAKHPKNTRETVYLLVECRSKEIVIF